MRPSDITPTNPAPQLDERLGEPRTGQELEFCFQLCVSGEQQLLRAAAWARIFDASRGLVVSYTVMDVLIVERDELIGTVLADALDQDGLTATLVPDEQEAFDLPPHDAPRVVITGMNRGPNEDMAGLHIARALRKKWPGIAVIYMAALWPVRLHRCALAVRERFLAKPVPLAKMIRTVRELLAADMRRQAG